MQKRYKEYYDQILLHTLGTDAEIATIKALPIETRFVFATTTLGAGLRGAVATVATVASATIAAGILRLTLALA